MQRVPAPRLAETSNKDVVAGVKEEQARVLRADHAIDRSAGIAEFFVAAHVERKGHYFGTGTLKCGVRLVEGNGRKVLDAVKAQIFKRFNCLALPGPG
jgi:hypothetical protein